MSAPDFYFVVNAMARYLHDKYGKQVLVDYWRSLGREYYRYRWEHWRSGGLEAVASDWRAYFDQEPQSCVAVEVQDDCVVLDIRVCPVIKHLHDCDRDIVPYFCDHCDHTCGAMAQEADLLFERTGGMGSCRQRFVQRSVEEGDR